MRFTDQKIDKSSKVALKTPYINFLSAVSLTDQIIGAVKPGHPFLLMGLDAFCTTKAGAASIQAIIAPDDAILLAGAIAVDAAPEKYNVGVARYRVGGVHVLSAAAAAQTFTLAHTVTALMYGVILIQVSNAGVFSTKVSLATQAYANAALALAALPAPDAGKKRVGYIAIQAGVADWVGNTSDMTAASDLAAVTFVTDPAVGRALNPALDFIAGKVAEAVLHATLANIRGGKDDSILLLLTTDGTGVLTNAAVQPIYRPQPMAGDGSHE